VRRVLRAPGDAVPGGEPLIELDPLEGESHE
jgi:hypothetical protein